MLQSLRSIGTRFADETVGRWWFDNIQVGIWRTVTLNNTTTLKQSWSQLSLSNHRACTVLLSRRPNQFCELSVACFRLGKTNFCSKSNWVGTGLTEISWLAGGTTRQPVALSVLPISCATVLTQVMDVAANRKSITKMDPGKFHHLAEIGRNLEIHLHRVMWAFRAVQPVSLPGDSSDCCCGDPLLFSNPRWR